MIVTHNISNEIEELMFREYVIRQLIDKEYA